MLILCVMLFSTLFIAAEADHDCKGEDCPICACIQQCENSIRQIGNGSALQMAIVAPFVFIIVSAFFVVFDLPQETLVLRKVRLNN